MALYHFRARSKHVSFSGFYLLTKNKISPKSGDFYAIIYTHQRYFLGSCFVLAIFPCHSLRFCPFCQQNDATLFLRLIYIYICKTIRSQQFWDWLFSYKGNNLPFFFLNLKTNCLYLCVTIANVKHKNFKKDSYKSSQGWWYTSVFQQLEAGRLKKPKSKTTKTKTKLDALS